MLAYFILLFWIVLVLYQFYPYVFVKEPFEDTDIDYGDFDDDIIDAPDYTDYDLVNPVENVPITQPT
jgi:hypothetical protein